MTHTIYIKLLDEGVDVWRPAVGMVTDTPGAFVIVGAPSGQDVTSETWEFPVGATVLCETREKDGEEVLIAVRLLSVDGE